MATCARKLFGSDERAAKSVRTGDLGEFRAAFPTYDPCAKPYLSYD